LRHIQDNTVDQTAAAFRSGSYGNVNLQRTPRKKVLTGLEFAWGEPDQQQRSRPPTVPCSS
jgi:hypothetical protein